MTKPEDFILSTDYATLKNDATGITTVSIPASQVIPASIGPNGSYLEYHSDLEIGTIGALTRIQISSTKDSNAIYATRTADYGRTGSTPSGPGISSYSVDAFLYRISPTTVRCQVYILNQYPEPLTTEAGVETITFYVNTFLAPYA